MPTMGARAPRTLRDKRRTSMYYVVTAVFAAVLILAAVAIFRSPSDDQSEVNAEKNVPGESDNKEVFDEEGGKEEKNVHAENDSNKDSSPTESEAEKVTDEKSGEKKVEGHQTEKDAEKELNDAEEKELGGPDEDKSEVTKPDDKQSPPEEEEEEEPEEKLEEKPKEEPVEEPKKTEADPLEEPAVNKTELELNVENKEISNNWTTQANESKQEIKESVPSSASSTEDGTSKSDIVPPVEETEASYNWELCRFTNAADYIPCLDNQKAIKKLKSRSHYEHRERHCPTGDDIKKCLVPLPQGYQAHVNWPQSRKQVWYSNVPHPGLVSYKKDQNWVRKKDDLLIFPGGGTQFKQGAVRYIEFIEISVPEIAWGKHTRTVLDVGCGVASFGGFLFDKNVLTMSLAPKDEHDAQVQLALERGIPAILAVMGTQRLVYPSKAYDVAHCARCRVPWHADGGKLILELNRLIRPGGYFVWSATPVYKYEQEDKDLWRDTKAVIDTLCWKLLKREKDPRTGVGIAIFQKPTTNTCYETRQKAEPPLCNEADNPDAAWYVPMQSCIHKLPAEGARGSSWPQEWPQRLNSTPAWLSTIPRGLFGGAAAEEFQADTQHWQRVVEKSYLSGLEIDWTVIRNVMDMKAGYGGFAAALVGRPVWVLNVIPVTEPDTLPIIFERGLIGQYHDWCESFSTYPRSYDLLHADHLFSRLKNKCGVVNAVVEMDRILRPGGWGVFRDTTTILGEIRQLLESLHWEIRVSYTQDQEQLIAAQKTFWRPKS